MLLVPMLAMNEEKPKNIGDPKTDEPPAPYFRVLFDDDRVENIEETDYICSVVAAEMPASYESEALKAQAVAAYTYACFKRNSRQNEKYDVTASSQSDQAYITMEDVRKRWGDKADEYEKKIRSAVESVIGYKITYNGAPIFAAFHAISSGKTETGKNVWGVGYEYLTSVESIGDLIAEGYLSSVTFTEDEFKKKAETLEITLTGDASKWLGEAKRTDTGMVSEYTLGGKTVKGTDVRKAFGLRSANFDLAFADGKFTFTVRGYGHGVGMSQNGANYMARQGSTFLEILSWYYPECKLEK